MPKASLDNEAARWLLPIAVLFSIPVLATGKLGNIPLLIPFWALTAYGMARGGKAVGLRQLVLCQIALGLLIIGMLAGPWQNEPILNRIGHGLVALGLAALLCAELKAFAPLWMACLCALGISVTLGVGMELAEALAGMGDVVLITRWHDTIADLWANLVGAFIGAVSCYVGMRKQHPQG